MYNSYHYSTRLFDNPQKIIESYLQANLPDHDTLIGTGISGSIAAALMATASHRMFAVVRKPNDSSHSKAGLEGKVGNRWLFVDDFISSGATYVRTCSVVNSLAPSTELIGGWLYLSDEFYIPAVLDSRVENGNW